MGSSQIRVPFQVLFIRVPYYLGGGGDRKRDPNLENYSYRVVRGFVWGLGLGELLWGLRGFTGFYSAHTSFVKID